MMNNFQLEEGKYGTKMIVTSNWEDSFEEVIKNHQIKELYLNYAKGWKGKDLSFLKSIKDLDLKAITILDFTIKDITPIHFLTSLRYLNISTYCNTKIDFTKFPFLEECFLEWRKGAESLFHCKTLNKLYINCYKGKNADPFSNLKDLKSLKIGNSPIDNIEGLRHLHQLKELGLYYLRKLTSLQGIENLVHLEVLDLKTCRKVNSLAEIEKLINLKKLFFINMGEIDSIKVLEKLPNLEWVLFYESTNILDGDLTPLTKLPRLSRLAFQNRRHYTHRREDFSALQR